jgi:hypothetical protein
MLLPIMGFGFNLLAFTDNDHWVAGIGDPTPLGWVTVGAYFVASVICWMNAFSKASPTRIERLFWMAFGLGMAALGINKQLDLQTWFTLTAKSLAKSEGWYEQRQIFQTFFIAAIAIVGAGSLALLWAVVRRAPVAYRLAVIGGVFLMCFIVVRAASFHHVDQLLGVQVGALKMNHILELGGIGCIALGALRAQRTKRKFLGPSGPEQFQWRHCASP